MRNAVFDPAIFFISEIDWLNNTRRDLFLRHLHDNLLQVDDYSVAKILWSDALENCLWAHPQVPPWRRDRDTRNQLVPIIYKIFQKNKNTIDCCESEAVCSVDPLMSCVNPDALLCFFKLMHKVSTSIPDILLCLGLENVLSINSSYVFSCTCCSHNFAPELIITPIDWLNYIDLEEKYWPENILDSDKLIKALQIVRIRDFSGAPFLYEFEFSSKFINELAATQTNKIDILQQIVKRLILTNQQAARDATLKNEYLRKKREYRFRVTPRPSSARIHYSYGSDRIITFLSYYSAGHHDDGLH